MKAICSAYWSIGTVISSSATCRIPRAAKSSMNPQKASPTLPAFTSLKQSCAGGCCRHSQRCLHKHGHLSTSNDIVWTEEEWICRTSTCYPCIVNHHDEIISPMIRGTSAKICLSSSSIVTVALEGLPSVALPWDWRGSRKGLVCLIQVSLVMEIENVLFAVSPLAQERVRLWQCSPRPCCGCAVGCGVADPTAPLFPRSAVAVTVTVPRSRATPVSRRTELQRPRMSSSRIV